MLLKIDFQEIINEKTWNGFLHEQPWYTFLQSFEWGEFQKLNKNKIFRIGGYLNGKLALISLIIKIKAKRGSFLLCPHGPLIAETANTDKHEIFAQFTDYLRDLSKKENVAFFRLCPVLENTAENNAMLSTMGYRFAPIHQHAETTWLLDLDKSPEILLSDMRKTTRYLIKRAEKEGVKIAEDNSETAIAEFIKMHKVHAKQTNYEAFSGKYIVNLFKAFGNNISLKFAKYNGDATAGSVIIYSGAEAAYYLAVSDNKHPQFSPAYLLQWAGITQAKNRGVKRYNFWGISPDANPNHPLAGVSLFKRGFGGYTMDLAHARDLPVSWRYWLNWLIEKVRAQKRGYYYLKPEK